MTMDELKAMPRSERVVAMLGCCGARAWAETMADAMADAGGSASAADLYAAGDRAFESLAEADWLEAFGAHPKLGDMDSLRMKFHGNAQWSAGEQAGAAAADEATLRNLADGNAAYEAKFGFIFILCASGLTAQQMLDALRDRLGNPREVELRNAAEQQRRITGLRLDKLLA
ncbi:MAG: 2-oxo-4-hydroxy-4-carboxy-5-ureidoimidazoline decarboxylase [Planctomycetota bacterium]